MAKCYSNDMQKERKFFSCFFSLLFISQILFSQDLPIVAVYSLNSSSPVDTMFKTVNDLVFSFIREQRTYHVLDMRSDALPDNIPDGTDYMFYGYLNTVSDGFKLELILTGGPYTITRKISRVYANSNRILLESRMLVRELFDQSVELPDPAIDSNFTTKPESVTQLQKAEKTEFIPVSDVNSLAGSWKEESDIEKIMILRGGRGVMVLSSGISISLELMISGEHLVVRQKGDISPRQFTDLPDNVAKSAANIAPPMEWYFLISSDNNILSGKKQTVTFKHDGKNILSMTGITQDIEWIRQN